MDCDSFQRKHVVLSGGGQGKKSMISGGRRTGEQVGQAASGS